jgi:hypothetical protein
MREQLRRPVGNQVTEPDQPAFLFACHFARSTKPSRKRCMNGNNRASEAFIWHRKSLSAGFCQMISANDYGRRMAALHRAEAVRGHNGAPLSRLAEVALARRCAARPGSGGVDPVAASKMSRAWLLQA